MTTSKAVPRSDGGKATGAPSNAPGPVPEKRTKPTRLSNADDIQALQVDPDDPDAVQRIGAIEQNIASRAPPVRTRGPSGVSRTAVDRLDDPPAASGIVLLERVLESIERELIDIDKVTGKGHVPQKQRGEAERRARVLASLAKTLGEVTRLRDLQDKKARPADDDAVPRDLDEFRRELSRRLEGFAATPQDLPAGGHDGEGDAVSVGAVGDLCASASETS